jgi:hypothetical protein
MTRVINVVNGWMRVRYASDRLEICDLLIAVKQDTLPA